MTPGEIAAILVRLDHQDEAIGEIKTSVHEVLAHAKVTNGRVNALEIDAKIAKALAQDRSRKRSSVASRRAWLVPCATGAGATFGAAVLSHFLG